MAIAAQVLGDNSVSNDAGYVRADKAFLYITNLTMGHRISRGLAKAGSRDRHHDKSRNHEH